MLTTAKSANVRFSQVPSTGVTWDMEVTWDKSDQLSVHLLNSVSMIDFVETDLLLSYLLILLYNQQLTSPLQLIKSVKFIFILPL